MFVDQRTPYAGRMSNSSRDKAVRPIRMSAARWDELGRVYGSRSAVLNEMAAFLLREPGAKMPPRAPLPEDVTTHVAS